jgi:hypothetical protein
MPARRRPRAELGWARRVVTRRSARPAARDLGKPGRARSTAVDSLAK